MIPRDHKDDVSVTLAEEPDEVRENVLEVKVQATDEPGTEELVNTSAVVEVEPESKDENNAENTEQLDEQEENVQNVSIDVGLESDETEAKIQQEDSQEQTDEADGKAQVFLEYEINDELPWARYRSLDAPPSRPAVEEDDEWPQSEEDEDYGRCYSVPPLP